MADQPAPAIAPPPQLPPPNFDLSAFGNNFSSLDPVAQATQGVQGALQAGATPTPGTTIGAPEQQQIQAAAQDPLAIQAKQDADITAAENTLKGQFAADEAKLDARFKTAESAANDYVSQFTEQNKGFVAREQHLFDEAEANRERQAQAQEAGAAQLKTDADRIQAFAQKTPTKQAAYAAAMHTTPLLAILAAIGGAATRTSAMAMLGATNGIVQGVTQGAENKFSDAVNQWRAQYDAMKEHMNAMQQYWGDLTKAYGDRADASEKAADHTRTVFNDKITPAQLKMTTTAGLLQEQANYINQLENHKIMWEKILEQRAIRAGAAAQLNEQTLRFAANWALTSGNMIGAMGLLGRGQNTFMARQELMGMMQKLYAEQHGGEQKYAGPGGSQQLAHDAAAYTFAVAQNNTAALSAMRTAGQQSSRIAGAAGDMFALAPTLQAAAIRVGQNHHWKAWNQLVQDTALQLSDPDVALLVEQAANFVQDWNTVGSRGSGRSTGAEREEREKRLSTVYDADTFLTLVNGGLVDAQLAKTGYNPPMQYSYWNPGVSGAPPIPQTPDVPLPPTYMYGVPGGLPSTANAPPGGMPGPFPGGAGGFPAQPGYQPGAQQQAPTQLGPEWRDVK